MYQVADGNVLAKGGRALLRRGTSVRISKTVIFLGLTSMLTDVSSEMVTAVLPLYLIYSLGLSPLLVEDLFALIRTINAEGIAILLVEQNVVQSLEVAQRAYILDNGLFVLQGPAADIRNDPNLKRAYLGM